MPRTKTKKKLQVPFDAVTNRPVLNKRHDRDRVCGPCSTVNDIIFKDNYEFTAIMKYHSATYCNYGVGVVFKFKDVSTNTTYYLENDHFKDIVLPLMIKGEIDGLWTFYKGHGGHYIKLIRRI